MSETRDLTFLFYSPEYKQDAAFVTACYKEMLDRDVEAEELFRWCRQLDGVYSRKSLIAAISGSAKFNNRFEIKDLEQYKKRAFIPRAIQHVINKINTGAGGYDKGCYGWLPRKTVAFGDYPAYVEQEKGVADEIDMLSLCQIEVMREYLQKLSSRLGSVHAVGTLAEDLVENSDSADTVFVTYIDAITNLLSGKCSEERYDNLLLTIPVPTEAAITAVFDKNWSARTKDSNPRRWLVNRGEGTLLLLNNREYPVGVTLSFNLTSLVKGSGVRISQGQNSITVLLRKKAARVTLHTVLQPGANPISFQFIGTIDGAVEEITNIAISKMFINGIADDLSTDMARLGSGYYSTAMPDSKIRNILHNRGYSEIECIRFYKDNSIQREDTTRFLQHDPNSSGDSFYVLKKGEKQENTSTSVRLYIAKKTGDIEE